MHEQSGGHTDEMADQWTGWDAPRLSRWSPRREGATVVLLTQRVLGRALRCGTATLSGRREARPLVAEEGQEKGGRMAMRHVVDSLFDVSLQMPAKMGFAPRLPCAL